jgi:deazaflavin-dependent oxidoreductase (nitroreductase family)
MRHTVIFPIGLTRGATMKEYPLDDGAREALAAHVRRYQETDGRDGAVVVENGRQQQALLLTTTGRRSGEPRTTALYYGRDGDDWLIVASLAGYDHSPQWYLNLCAEPQVKLQIGGDHFDGVARTATADERPRLWEIVTEVYPVYDDYQSVTEREIPVVVVEARS